MNVASDRNPSTPKSIPSELGVNVYGYVYAESGVGEHTRLLIASIKAAGIPYSVVPVTDSVSRQQFEFTDDRMGEAAYPVNIVGINADVFPDLIDNFGKSAFDGTYTIGLWAWEIEHFPDWMARSAEYVDEVWANSSFSAAAIAKAIDKVVVPFPLPIAAPTARIHCRAELELPEGPLFMFCCDLDSIVRRKNPIGVVEAFAQAFSEGEGPCLLVKTVNGDRHPAHMEDLLRAAGNRRDVIIRDGYVSAAKQGALMDSCDVYVSLHRSEGFGLTLAEAMALGKPVIATGYSGNLDFMTSTNSYLVPYEMVSVGDGCDPYPASAEWAEPDIGSAADLMRRVVADPDEARAVGSRARIDVERHHGPEARGRFITQRLLEVTS
jgi:glycosyltransferase involved in cell wall biosynthesis